MAIIGFTQSAEAGGRLTLKLGMSVSVELRKFQVILQNSRGYHMLRIAAHILAVMFFIA